MYAKTIISCSLPFAWQSAVNFVRKSPYIIQFGGGKEIKHARDSQVQIILDEHAIEDALNHKVHPSDPFCSKERLQAYIEEYKSTYDASKFSYTYRNELETTFVKIDNSYLNQITKLRDGLKKQIEENLPSNRNIAILYNPLKWDMNSASPCWDILWIRYEKTDEDGIIWVSITTFYRSHDLTDAWESNFIAQVTMVQEEILNPLKAKILSWRENNASLHIYEHNIKMANNIKEIYVNSVLQFLQVQYNKMNYM